MIDYHKLYRNERSRRITAERNLHIARERLDRVSALLPDFLSSIDSLESKCQEVKSKLE